MILYQTKKKRIGLIHITFLCQDQSFSSYFRFFSSRDFLALLSELLSTGNVSLLRNKVAQLATFLQRVSKKIVQLFCSTLLPKKRYNYTLKSSLNSFSAAH